MTRDDGTFRKVTMEVRHARLPGTSGVDSNLSLKRPAIPTNAESMPIDKARGAKEGVQVKFTWRTLMASSIDLSALLKVLLGMARQQLQELGIPDTPPADDDNDYMHGIVLLGQFVRQTSIKAGISKDWVTFWGKGARQGSKLFGAIGLLGEAGMKSDWSRVNNQYMHQIKNLL